MNRVLAAVVILIAGSAFVVLQAWVLRGWTRHRVEAAALELANPVTDLAAGSPVILFTPLQKRIYLWSFIVSTGLLVAGAILASSGAEPSTLSLALMISGVAMVPARQAARYCVGRAAMRSRKLRT